MTKTQQESIEAEDREYAILERAHLTIKEVGETLERLFAQRHSEPPPPKLRRASVTDCRFGRIVWVRRGSEAAGNLTLRWHRVTQPVFLHERQFHIQVDFREDVPLADCLMDASDYPDPREQG